MEDKIQGTTPTTNITGFDNNDINNNNNNNNNNSHNYDNSNDYNNNSSNNYNNNSNKNYNNNNKNKNSNSNESVDSKTTYQSYLLNSNITSGESIFDEGVEKSVNSHPNEFQDQDERETQSLFDRSSFVFDNSPCQQQRMNDESVSNESFGLDNTHSTVNTFQFEEYQRSQTLVADESAGNIDDVVIKAENLENSLNSEVGAEPNTGNLVNDIRGAQTTNQSECLGETKEEVIDNEPNVVNQVSDSREGVTLNIYHSEVGKNTENFERCDDDDVQTEFSYVQTLNNVSHHRKGNMEIVDTGVKIEPLSIGDAAVTSFEECVNTQNPGQSNNEVVSVKIEFPVDDDQNLQNIASATGLLNQNRAEENSNPQNPGLISDIDFSGIKTELTLEDEDNIDNNNNNNSSNNSNNNNNNNNQKTNCNNIDTTSTSDQETIRSHHQKDSNPHLRCLDIEMKTQVCQESDTRNPELVNGSIVLKTELSDEQSNVNDADSPSNQTKSSICTPKLCPHSTKDLTKPCPHHPESIITKPFQIILTDLKASGRLNQLYTFDTQLNRSEPSTEKGKLLTLIEFTI